MNAEPEVCRVLRSFGDAKPEAWAGTYELRIAGKMGETLISTGVLPALRRRLPKARIVWRAPRVYWPVFECLIAPPDEVLDYPLGSPDDNPDLAIQVQASVGHYPTQGIDYDTQSGRLSVNLYRWYDRALARPTMPSGYAAAAGLFDDEWELPQTRRLERGCLALALPTANCHSNLRSLNASAAAWQKTATMALQAGLEPLANNRPYDRPFLPETPGWPVVEDEGVTGVLERLRQAQWCVGLNSGAAWAHVILGPTSSRLSMLDPQKLPAFEFSPAIAGFFTDPGRHRQTKWMRRVPFDLDRWLIAEAEWGLTPTGSREA